MDSTRFCAVALALERIGNVHAIRPGDIVRVSAKTVTMFAGAKGIVIEVHRGAYNFANVYFSDRFPDRPFPVALLEVIREAPLN